MIMINNNNNQDYNVDNMPIRQDHEDALRGRRFSTVAPLRCKITITPRRVRPRRVRPRRDLLRDGRACHTSKPPTVSFARLRTASAIKLECTVCLTRCS